VTADRTIGTQMKATGEVMSIGRTFESALQKALRSLEVGVHGLRAKNVHTWTEMELEVALRQATDERLFAVAEAFRRGWEIREVQSLSHIDPWFLHKIRDLVRLEDRFEGRLPSDDPEFMADLVEAKRNGLSDRTIADRCGVEGSRNPGVPLAARPQAGLQDGGHLRRRVRGRHALLLQRL
jgi:carbamoyl-phosphate synthase large subunit